MIKKVWVDGTAVVVELENGERVREHSATAVLMADMWRKANSDRNEALIKKIDKRIVAVRVKRA